MDMGTPVICTADMVTPDMAPWDTATPHLVTL